MDKFWPHAWQHSGLYYRNTIIVLGVTLFVVAMAISIPFHWISIFVFSLGLYFNYLLWSIYFSVHPRRTHRLPNPSKSNLYKNSKPIEFLSQDGLNLHAWLIPGDRREIILLLHGLGGSCTSMFPQARMLNRAGYSVMLLDLRAHGKSEGDTITGLWEVYDVLSALEFLASSPDVDANKVGVWGIAIGAQIALRTAAKAKVIRALVLESMEPVTLVDRGLLPETFSQQFAYLLYRFQDKLIDFMSGVKDREGILEILHLIYPRPVLFISTSRGRERYYTRRFYDRARWPKACLELPQTENKGQAIYDQEYRESVLQLFDQAFS